MGTSYDCFSVRSFTRSKQIGAEQQSNRERLRSAMSQYGFKNYVREWWHYTYTAGANPQIYDVPIARPVR
jgi:D-alanyl-D-alanine dipeptidase